MYVLGPNIILFLLSSSSSACSSLSAIWPRF